MAGRVTLIKSILQAIPSFTMQLFLILKAITLKIDRIIKNIFWGFDMEKEHHLHLRSWDDICQLKEEGGLDIRKIRDMNTTMVLKLNWQLWNDSSKP